MPRFPSPRILALLLALIALHGCATKPAQPLPPAEARAVALADQVAVLLAHPLDARTRAQLLVAETQLYRRNNDAALDIYRSAAEQTADPYIARRAAEIALAGRDRFQALDAALAYLELAPADPHAVVVAVRSLVRNGEVEAAWELLSTTPGKTLEVRLLTGDAVRLAGQMRDNFQIKWLHEQLVGTYGSDPKSAEIQLALGLIHRQLNEWQAAADYAAQAFAQMPDNAAALRLHVDMLLRSGNERENKREEAAAAMRTWFARNSGDLATRIEIAELLAEIDPAAALPALTKMNAQYPWSGRVLWALARLHQNAGAPDQALPYYQQMAEFTDDFRALALFNLGRIYEQQKDLPQAAENYRALLAGDLSRIRPEIVFSAQTSLARIAYQTDAGTGAALFAQLRDRYPDERRTLFREEGAVLAEQDRPTKAIAILSEGLADYPDDRSMLYTRALAYEQADKIAAAEADLRRMLALNAEDATALNALGYTLTDRTDRHAEALKLIQRALAIEPENPAIIDSMGWVLHRLGRHEEALAYLQRAHAALVDEEIIAHLAEVLMALDRREEAKAILEQGLKDLSDSTLLPQTRTRLGLDP
ncbi:MAG: tetratricopeptide repeat protein [Cellvibrionales bacterium]|nr:tetratricopeptide repeat protein [Cellvibrionales bacterium]